MWKELDTGPSALLILGRCLKQRLGPIVLLACQKLLTKQPHLGQVSQHVTLLGPSEPPALESRTF